MPTPQINVGFDFGTSSSKICYYDIINETHHLFVFDKNLRDNSRYCKPSIIRFEDDKIYFSDIPRGYRIELFKIDMHNKDYGPEDSHLTKKIKGYQLVAIYCAYILKVVQKYILLNYKNAKLFFQFGIPVDHLSNLNYPDSEKEKMFRIAFGIAMILKESNVDIEGMSATEILKLLTAAEKKYTLINNKEELFSIYPETIAGVGALLLNYTLDRRFRYSIVDIGAGTTDFSFFQFGDIANPDGQFYIYYSKTTDIGSKNNIKNITSAKNNLQAEFKKGFGNSYFLAKQYWDSNFKLLFLGGGSRGPLKKFKDKLELTVKRDKFHRDIVSAEEINFPIPNNVFDAIDKKYKGWEDWFDFLAVSYGLSYPGPTLPLYNPQVTPMIKDDIPTGLEEPLTPDVG